MLCEIRLTGHRNGLGCVPMKKSISKGWSLRHPTLYILLVLLLALPVTAQDSTAAPSGTLALNITETNLQTGQYYDVTLAFEAVSEAWLLSTEITYDPQVLYVYGTQSRSAAITPGNFFDSTLSVILQNYVLDNKLNYLVSLVAPAEVTQGSGIVGTFRIFPLTSGVTTLSITNIEISSVTFTRNGEQLSASNPYPVIVTTRDLTLTISGEQATPPPEPTPTPYIPPSPTPFATVDSTEGAAFEVQLTVTAAAFATQIATPTTVIVNNSISPMLIVAIVLIVIAAFGGGILLTLYLTRQKSRK
jgi:hypothetical protein